MKKYVIIIVIFIIALVVIGFGIKVYTVNLVAEQNKKALFNIDSRITQQEMLLTATADATRQNNADETLAKILADCTPAERQQFDTLLNKLSASISTPELNSLNNLFNKCGSFFADRRAVMASRLEREVGVYGDYVALRNSLLSEEDEVSNKRVTLWLQLADTEIKVAENISTLVKLQGDIINFLLQGKSKDSEEIATTLQAVESTRNNITVQNRQIENFRQEIISL